MSSHTFEHRLIVGVRNRYTIMAHRAPRRNDSSGIRCRNVSGGIRYNKGTAMQDISLHILDIVENSIGAGATLITVTVVEDLIEDILAVDIRDNGSGMSVEAVQHVLDPFFTTRTTRKVGLGLSFLAQSAHEAGGEIEISSVEGTGTALCVWFIHSHIDRKPLGNIAETFTVLIAGNPDRDFVFAYRGAGTESTFDTRRLREELEGIPFHHPEVLAFVRGYLKEHFPGR